MARLETPGTYHVKLTNCHWVKNRAKGADANRMQAVLSAVVETGPHAGEEITAYLRFDNDRIGSGNNTGRKWAEMSLETLESLGFKRNSPGSIGPVLEGRDASFVCDHREWQNDKGTTSSRFEVRWVNTLTAKPLDAGAVCEIWDSFGFEIGEDQEAEEDQDQARQAEAEQGQGEQAAVEVVGENDDEIPF